MVTLPPYSVWLRVDESLYFPNARFLEDCVNDAVAANPAVRHVILERPAVNAIDASVKLESQRINDRLKDGGITFDLSEVKGPIMDRLKSVALPRGTHRQGSPETLRRRGEHRPRAGAPHQRRRASLADRSVMLCIANVRFQCGATTSKGQDHDSQGAKRRTRRIATASGGWGQRRTRSASADRGGRSIVGVSPSATVKFAAASRGIL